MAEEADPASPHRATAESIIARHSTLERKRERMWRWVSGIVAALGLALGAYSYLESTDSGTISFVFLLILPSALSMFLGLLLGRGREWSMWHYSAIPATIAVVAVVVGAVLLREGVICLAMLAPLWILAGVPGALMAYALRPASRNSAQSLRSTFNAWSVLLVPIVAMAIEPLFPPPQQMVTVTSAQTIAASPATIWPHLLSIRSIDGAEGHSTMTHSLLRVPRPIDAALSGAGVGAIRYARWADGIRFEERITDWRSGQAISWRFHFPDRSIQHRTDRHINPHGQHLSVEAGGYRLIPLPGGQTQLELWTRYRLATPVNGYARWWGRRMLGDVQSNILAIIAGRAERPSPQPGTRQGYRN